ncbi:sugar ABC transporter ATP-binding protein [Paracoccus sp. p4-l81]|uniref:sugar ABC transporter ATP-binding protein n=1 Tax=unclassified Paracoccus (in: a-proteobacteria) TaxID=2688777 RepID=UPI0035BB9DE9
MAADTVLSLAQVTCRFGRLTALDDVSFDLTAGEVHCLAGENGCGKSTLIKIVNGVYAPEAGARIALHGGAAQARLTPSQARAAGIHVIWQDLALFPDLTLAENIGYDSFVARPLAPPNRADLAEQARAVLARLGLDLDPATRLGDLPIAQRQLIAIARVLAADARIVFMDEPTASLTQAEVAGLLAAVRRMTDDGIAVVFVSHRLAEVLDIADRVTVLRDGRKVGTFPARGMTQSRLTTLMTGRELTDTPRAPKAFDTPVLTVQGLTRTGQFHDIDLTLHKGEIVGLTGLLGSGRTELALCLFGMTRPDAGQILLDGVPQAFRSNRDAIRAGLAYVSEDRLNLGLIQVQSIADNAAMAALPRIGRAAWLWPRALADLARDWVGRLSIKAHDVDLPVNSLSGGNQQRVVLAKWLATQPRVLILDAPTVGVDVGAKEGIFRIVRDLADQGMAILVISDEASELRVNCDRILVLRDGRLTRQIDPRHVTDTQIEEAAHA